MKKEAQVVMLPTDKTDGTLWKTTNGQLIHTHVDDEFKQKYQPFHLYIVDDSEIKEGDWCINGNGKGLLVKVERHHSQGELSTYKKIIATTDTQLLVQGSTPEESKEWRSVFELPSIPTSFIESYCQNPVEKVMVECIGTCTNCGEQHEDSVLCMSMQNAEYDARVAPYTIKLTSNNELIIHPIEEKMYTREEVAALCKQAFSFGVRLWEDWEKEDYEMWCKFKEEYL